MQTYSKTQFFVLLAKTSNEVQRKLEGVRQDQMPLQFFATEFKMGKKKKILNDYLDNVDKYEI
jgi:hypothetical protein